MPLKLKEIGVAFSVAMLSIFSFIVLQSMLLVASSIGFGGCMFLFASCSLAGTVFVIVYLPETKGRSYEEIMNLLRWTHASNRMKSSVGGNSSHIIFSVYHEIEDRRIKNKHKFECCSENTLKKLLPSFMSIWKLSQLETEWVENEFFVSFSIDVNIFITATENEFRPKEVPNLTHWSLTSKKSHGVCVKYWLVIKRD